MYNLEKSAVKIVAKLAPWLAPLPSAFFVARAGMAHLDMPLAVALVAAAIIETLGLSTVHTCLWLADWNRHKRKTDPAAPTYLAMAFIGVYLVATVGLTVVLEVVPSLALIGPALFPALTLVGAVNLVLIARQEDRETAVVAEKAERKAARAARKAEQVAAPPAMTGRRGGNGHQRMSFAEFCRQHPAPRGMKGRHVAEIAGVSARTGRDWLAKIRQREDVDVAK